MNHLERLKQATIKAQQEDDLPDFLADRIFVIVVTLVDDDLRDEIIDLTHLVLQYDTFGQTGYCGMGVDNHILACRIERIETLISTL